MFQSTSDERFVTLFCAVLDPVRHRLTFSNAGHDRPFLLTKNKKVRRLKTGGIVLGVMEKFPFEEETITLGEDDLLVIYSDGIAEAMNEREELFGEEQIERVIRRHQKGSAAEIIDHIVAAARAHAGKYPQSDDMTIVVLKRTVME